MTIEELINKLGLAEVSKVDRQLLDHLLHLYNTGQIKAVSISREAQGHHRRRGLPEADAREGR